MLDLGRLGLRGAIPASVGKMSTLEKLSFFRNQLTGSIPKELGSAPKLVYLGLRSNKLTGPIPTTVMKLLAKSTDVGPGLHIPPGLELPTDIGSLEKACRGRLKVLELPGNGLVATLPESLGDLLSLQTLNLSGNELEGPLPCSLGKLKKLQFLDISFNKFSQEVPEELGAIAGLRELMLRGNFFTSLGLHFGTFKKIERVDVSENPFDLNPEEMREEIANRNLPLGVELVT